MSQSCGAYPAARAAALSGVPTSTVHFWAREEILVPSVSAERIKLWSYPDLMGLRTISWLRQDKTAADGARVPRTAMPAVRRALEQLAELDLSLWTEERGPAVAVDRGGSVVVLDKPGLEASGRQRRMPGAGDELLTITDAFNVPYGGRGPDLNAPRPHLRIVPGKLGGAPHVARTRVESQALSALATSGLPVATVYSLYPSLSHEAIDDALSLERQLQQNLGQRAA